MNDLKKRKCVKLENVGKNDLCTYYFKDVYSTFKEVGIDKVEEIISNGKTVAVIKKKYKKIYYYPIRTTLLFTILQKEKIFHLIRNNKPTIINSNLIGFGLIEKKLNKFKIFFEKKSLEFKGWETKDAYSNNVSFIISNLKTNMIIDDKFFKIPKEEDL